MGTEPALAFHKPIESAENEEKKKKETTKGQNEWFEFSVKLLICCLFGTCFYKINVRKLL